VSIGQQFKVSAIIRNAGDANVYGDAKVRLNLDNSGVTTTDELEKDFDFPPGENVVQVVWNVLAPDSTTGVHQLFATITEIPFDENSDATAANIEGSNQRDLPVQTVDQGNIVITSFTVNSPAGAADGTLSTIQQFTVEATVQWFDVDDRSATLGLPLGYQTSNPTQDLDNESGRQTVQWTVTAPGEARPQEFMKVTATAKDENDPLVTFSDSDSIAFDVVSAASLRLDSEITSPESATDGVLTVGQNFVVTASLTNNGTAGVVGTDSARITVPGGYNLSGVRIQGIDAGGQVSWNITAPNAPTDIAQIQVEIIARNSQDENGSTTPPLTPDTPVLIAVITQASGLQADPVAGVNPTTIAKGDVGRTMLGLQFSNDSDDEIEVRSLRVNVYDGEGASLAPNTIFSGASVVDGEEESNVFATIQPGADNPLIFNFSPAISVPPGEDQIIHVQVDILTQTDVTQFSLSVDSPQDDIDAQNVSSDEPATIIDDAGQPISSAIQGGTSVLFNGNLAESFYNFPNPFGDNRTEYQQTSFNYHLESSSDVNIRIYTLFGELVKTFSFTSSDPEGQSGTHSEEIFWDAKNDKGQDVLNGVYIAVIATSSGTATTKIAVAR
jgi:hypothetical protein